MPSVKIKPPRPPIEDVTKPDLINLYRWIGINSLLGRTHRLASVGESHRSTKTSTLDLESQEFNSTGILTILALAFKSSANCKVNCDVL